VDLTVREALGMENLKNAKVIAGKKGLDRLICCVDISETPDSCKWVRANEFLITTGYSIKDNLSAQMSLLRSLAEAGGAGLAIKFGRFIGEVPQELANLADTLEFPLISLPDNLPFIDITYPLMSRIVNAQAQRLAYSERVYQTLTKVALETNSLEKLSDALQEIIEKTVSIYPHQLRSSVLAMMQEYQIFPVEVKNRLYGYIAVKSRQSLSDQEMVAVQHARTLAALQMVNYELTAESTWNEQRDFLEEIFSGNFRNMELLKARAAEFGFSLDGAKCICIVNVDNFSQHLLQQNMTEQQAFTFRRALFHIVREALFQVGGCSKRSLAVQQNDRVLVLCSDEDTIKINWTAVLPQIHKKTTELSPKITVTIGISNRIEKLTDLAQGYEQTRHLVAISRRLHGYGGDLFQKDAEIYLLLEKMDILPFCDTMLGNLSKTRKEEEFLNTLRVYLDCQGNLAETAAKLFIHRHTLRYRLSRIEVLLGKDLNCPETRFMLWLVLKARQLKEI